MNLKFDYKRFKMYDNVDFFLAYLNWTITKRKPCVFLPLASFPRFSNFFRKIITGCEENDLSCSIRFSIQDQFKQKFCKENSCAILLYIHLKLNLTPNILMTTLKSFVCKYSSWKLNNNLTIISQFNQLSIIQVKLFYHTYYTHLSAVYYQVQNTL